MKIRLTEHALRRARERGIAINEIERVLKEASEVIDVRFGRKAAYRRVGDKFVVVIFEEQKDEIVVITTLKVDEERLKRYGFDRI